MSTNKAPLKPEGTIRKIGVKSKSNPDNPPYAVLVYPDGMIACPCIGFKYKKNCRHTKKVRQFLEETNAQTEQEPLEAAPSTDAVVDSQDIDRLLSG